MLVFYSRSAGGVRGVWCFTAEVLEGIGVLVFYSRSAGGDRGVNVLQQKCWREGVLVFYSRSAAGVGCWCFTAEVLEGKGVRVL